MTRRELKTLAKEQLRGKWLMVILITFIAGIFTNGNLINEGFKFLVNSSNISSNISFNINIPILQLIFGGVISVGLCTFALNLTNLNYNPEFRDLFSAFGIFLKTLGLNFIIGIIVFIGGLLLIVPGIIAALALSQAFYILAQDHNKSITDCLNESWQMMKGRKGEYFVLQLSFIGWGILSIPTLGLGLLWLRPYKLMTETNYYLSIKNEGKLYQ